MTDVSTTCAEAILRVLTLKMASAQVVETSVNNNSPSQDSNHLDDLFQSRYFFCLSMPSKVIMVVLEFMFLSLKIFWALHRACLLYTSDAADE